MSHESTAILVFAGIGLLAIVMLLLERRGIAKRRAARGGRDVDLSDVFDPMRENGKPTRQ